ncbi:MAG: hypothetical protein ABI855_08775 [Bacteroidota bacterium]
MSTGTYHEKRAKDADEKQVIYEQTVAELKNGERFKNYFSKYSEDTVNSFIELYARQKAEWFSNGDMMVNYRKHHELRWRQNAFMILEHIQLKKLFNAECEWRAEKIKFKEIEICFDFHVWTRHVLDCPFIKPVNEAELNLYISFLNDLSDEKSFDDYNIGNDYRALKDGYFRKGEHYSEYPAWYTCYDEHYGSHILLDLPDIRGEKEEAYCDLWREEQKPVWEEQNSGRDKRPNIRTLYDKEFAEWFLKEFDTKEILKLFRSTVQWDEKRQRTEEIEMDLINLGEADCNVPVEDDDDWRNGIKRGSEKYYREYGRFTSNGLLQENPQWKKMFSRLPVALRILISEMKY